MLDRTELHDAGTLAGAFHGSINQQLNIIIDDKNIDAEFYKFQKALIAKLHSFYFRDKVGEPSLVSDS